MPAPETCESALLVGLGSAAATSATSISAVRLPRYDVLSRFASQSGSCAASHARM